MIETGDNSLASLTTLQLNATASQVRDVHDDDELAAALALARESTMPVIVLGDGSNIVFAGDVNALVLRYRVQGRQILERNLLTVLLRVSAGENWHALTRWCLEQGFFGLENLALIPGTVGAAPIQNIGAYGVELATVVEAVHAVSIATGEAFSLDRDACEFAYRDSVFKRSLRDAAVITAVDLRLSLRDQPVCDYPSLRDHLAQAAQPVTAQAVFNAVVAIRSARLPNPAQVPNAGSFFKNPLVSAPEADRLAAHFPALPRYAAAGGRVKLAAAWMIEYCGYRGLVADGVGVHPGHALVLVNLGANSGARLLALASRIRASVRETFGCELEIEPRIYGAPA